MRMFSLWTETEMVDSSGDEIISMKLIIASETIEEIFKGIKLLLKEDEDWVFKIIRNAEEEE